MSMLTVATHFESIGELADGLSDRVEDGRIVLYGPDAYEEGDTIGFEVLLSDGTPAIAGKGVVVECVDGGEERDESVRYDVTLAGLDLDGASEAVYERMLDGAASAAAEAPAPVEEAAAPAPEPEPEPEPEPAPAPAPEPEPEPEPAPAPAPEPEPEPAREAEAVAAEAAFSDEATKVAQLDEFAHESERAAEREPERDESVSIPAPPAPRDSAPELAPIARTKAGSDSGEIVDEEGTVLNGPEEKGLPAPAAPPNPGGFDVALDLPDDRLSRAVRPPAWSPEPTPRQPSAPATGLFQYGGAVPLPAHPPRPGLDPSQRIARAPAAVDEATFHAMRIEAGFTIPGPAGGAAPAAYAEQEYATDVASEEFSVADELGADIEDS